MGHLASPRWGFRRSWSPSPARTRRRRPLFRAGRGVRSPLVHRTDRPALARAADEDVLSTTSEALQAGRVLDTQQGLVLLLVEAGIPFSEVDVVEYLSAVLQGAPAEV